MIKPGINFSVIPQKEIPFDGELAAYCILENTRDKALLYYPIAKGYRIITNNPKEYLSEEDINSLWVLSKYSPMEYCIMKSTKLK